MQMRMCNEKYWCAKEQKNKNKNGDEVGSWLDGLFTDGLMGCVQLQRSVSCSDSRCLKLMREI